MRNTRSLLRKCLIIEDEANYFDTLSHHYHYNIPQVHDQRKKSQCNQSENTLFSLKHFPQEAAAGVKGRLGDFPSNLKLLQVSREEL